MGFVTRQIKQVVKQEQTTLRYYSDQKRDLIFSIGHFNHNYKNDHDAWHMVNYYDQQIEECKEKIATWLKLFT